MSVINITTSEEFQSKVVDNQKLVLIDFWAEWCPPCRAMAPILEQLAKKKADALDVVKVDIEATRDNADLAAKHGVQGIPNFVLYKAGKQVGSLVGMRPLPVLERELAAHL